MIPRETIPQLDLSDVRTGEVIPNVTPGEVLREEFMKPHGLSARALAREINVPPNRITQILNGERAITAETAVRLGEHFGTTPRFWMNLQVAFDLEAIEHSHQSFKSLSPTDPAKRAIREDHVRRGASILAERALARARAQ